MNTDLSSVIWFNHNRTNCYLIVNIKSLPPGDLLLHTSLGDEAAVQAEALTPYAITRDEAEAWLKAQLGDVLGELRGNLINAARAYVDRRKPSAHESPAELVDHAAAIETVAGWLQPLSARAEARLRAKAAALRAQADRETSRGDADA